MKRHARVPVRGGESVHLMLIEPDAAQPQVVFVFSHGFTVDGTESARHFLVLAGTVQEQGCAAVLFDYRGSGYSDMAFEDMTFGSEVDDLTTVLDYTAEQFPSASIVVWAESFGTAVAARAISARSDVAAAIFWSLSADLYTRYTDRYGHDIELQGFVYTANGFVVRKIFLESLRHEDTFASIRNMAIPTLLVHGTSDDVASIELSRQARSTAPGSTAIVEIERGNHGFEAQPEQFGLALAASLKWIHGIVPFGSLPE